MGTAAGDTLAQYNYAAAYAQQPSGENTPPATSTSQNEPAYSQTNSSGRSRQRLPPETVKALDAAFFMARNPSANAIQELALQLNLEATKVKTWFNNRKAKEKRQQSTGAIDVTTGTVHPAHGYMADSNAQNTRILTTQSGYQFNIEEQQDLFNFEMFAAMRDRIIQLENHISNMVPAITATPKRSASEMSLAGGQYNISQNNSQSPLKSAPDSPDPSSGPPVKRLNVALSTVNAHLDAIVVKLKQEVSKREFPSLGDVCEIVLHESLTVDEFVAVFDDKGGSVCAVPKDTEDSQSEHLVSVEFNTPETVVNLLGPEIATDLQSTLQQGDAPAQTIECHVQSLNVLYDKVPGRVSMAFHVMPAPPTML